MILTPDTLIWLREKKCVLLDGTFDPLHAGHIRYFHEAFKVFPSHLRVVAVASDDDIRAKGREPFLDQASRCKVVQAVTHGYALEKNQPTEHLISRLKPAVYVKGKDWEGKLPAEQLAACSLNNVEIHYTDTVVDSSTDRLRRWALKDAEQSLDRLEAFIDTQAETPPERFDREYFTGDWRHGNGYTLEDRRRIEGDHPRILTEVFPFHSMLDVGCGPGFLVELLRERGVEAGGIDPSPAAKKMAVNRWTIKGYPAACPNKMADLVICREVLEHLTVRQICETVMHLFRLAKKAVYITTRFSDQSVFDVKTDFETDPTHISCVSQPFLRALCVLNGGLRRRDWEAMLDHQKKGRVLAYEVGR